MASGITFTCPICGGNQLQVDLDNDNSIARCGSCGSEFGRWGDIKANLGMPKDAGRSDDGAPKFKGMTFTGKVSGR